ncbi:MULTISPECIES: hypothetical protein [Halorussus]|uniref:hypothetical protein n=1 Tax=Halorussus TaxID=1070314 RepID=UPI00209F82CE|nr:hypothetical protein [Halorussus vallis]USZ78698.1 hypothetical protein NGM07_24620 [Halorussus vallis]
MTEENRSTEESHDNHHGDDNGRGNGNNPHVVFVDNIKDKISEDTVKASRLIEISFDKPGNYDLVATKGENGPEQAVFDHNDSVDLTEEHRKFFDTKGDGENYV